MSMPTPAAKSIATQVKRLYWGREWSGPRRTPPSCDRASQRTKPMKTTVDWIAENLGWFYVEVLRDPVDGRLHRRLGGDRCDHRPHGEGEDDERSDDEHSPVDPWTTVVGQLIGSPAELRAVDRCAPVGVGVPADSGGWVAAAEALAFDDG